MGCVFLYVDGFPGSGKTWLIDQVKRKYGNWVEIIDWSTEECVLEFMLSLTANGARIGWIGLLQLKFAKMLKNREEKMQKKMDVKDDKPVIFLMEHWPFGDLPFLKAWQTTYELILEAGGFPSRQCDIGSNSFVLYLRNSFWWRENIATRDNFDEQKKFELKYMTKEMESNYYDSVKLLALKYDNIVLMDHSNTSSSVAMDFIDSKIGSMMSGEIEKYKEKKIDWHETYAVMGEQ